MQVSLMGHREDEVKENTPKSNRNNNQRNRSNSINKISITAPYNKDLSENFKNIGKKYGIQVPLRVERP